MQMSDGIAQHTLGQPTLSNVFEITWLRPYSDYLIGVVLGPVVGGVHVGPEPEVELVRGFVEDNARRKHLNERLYLLLIDVSANDVGNPADTSRKLCPGQTAPHQCPACLGKGRCRIGQVDGLRLRLVAIDAHTGSGRVLNHIRPKGHHVPVLDDHQLSVPGNVVELPTFVRQRRHSLSHMHKIIAFRGMPSSPEL
jgi:hypothetical protein